MYVRMRSAFSHDLPNGNRRTIPANWAGNLDDDIAQAAIDGGFTSEPVSKRPGGATGVAVGTVVPEGGAASTTVTEPGSQTVTEDMTRDQLNQIAKSRGLNPDDYNTKADLVAALNG